MDFKVRVQTEEIKRRRLEA